MIALRFKPNLTELLTLSGARHQVPPEIVDQAEPGQILETVLKWGRKTGVLSQSEFQSALPKKCA